MRSYTAFVLVGLTVSASARAAGSDGVPTFVFQPYIGGFSGTLRLEPTQGDEPAAGEERAGEIEYEVEGPSRPGLRAEAFGFSFRGTMPTTEPSSDEGATDAADASAQVDEEVVSYVDEWVLVTYAKRRYVGSAKTKYKVPRTAATPCPPAPAACKAYVDVVGVVDDFTYARSYGDLTVKLVGGGQRPIAALIPGVAPSSRTAADWAILASIGASDSLVGSPNAFVPAERALEFGADAGISRLEVTEAYGGLTWAHSAFFDKSNWYFSFGLRLAASRQTWRLYTDAGEFDARKNVPAGSGAVLLAFGYKLGVLNVGVHASGEGTTVTTETATLGVNQTVSTVYAGVEF